MRFWIETIILLLAVLTLITLSPWAKIFVSLYIGLRASKLIDHIENKKITAKKQ